MPAKRTVFNDVFKTIIEFIPVSTKEITNHFGDCSEYSEDTVRSWRSRGLMSVQNFQYLLMAIMDATSEKRKESTCERLEELKSKLAPIWENWAVDMSHDEVIASDGFDGIIKTLLTVAYNNGKECHNEENDKPVRVVAFDFDGTLVKGIRHSWTVLWQAIGKTSEEATKHKAAFEAGKLSYTDWCKSDLEALRSGGLTMDMVKDAVKKFGCSLTKNLKEAVELLHKNNCKVAIISGGADCLLYALLPDAREIFDDIFINRVIFDGYGGIISDIIPTKYDWDSECVGVQGKDAGFERLCTKYGAKLEDSVFVGDDRNDFTAMKCAGMKILYHNFAGKDSTRATAARLAPTTGVINREIPPGIIIIGENDLMVVAKRIIDWNNFDD